MVDANSLGTYEGKRWGGDCHITRDGTEIEARLDLANHSPTGFEWGYGGSGPAQSALAILADCLDHVAIMLHQDFKFELIAALGRPPSTGEEKDDWEMEEVDVLRWVVHKIVLGDAKLFEV